MSNNSENIKTRLLFIVVVVFGGTGWIFLPSQIQFVPLELAVSYRFILAGGLLLAYGLIQHRGLLSLKKLDVFLLLMQGATLFCFNYMLCYMASQYMITGLIAISVSTIIVPTMILARVFLKDKIKLNVVSGSIIGLMGIVLVYWQDLSNFSLNNQTLIGFSFCFMSTFLSASGTVISRKLTRQGMPVLWVTGYSMLAGGVISLLWAVVRGQSIVFSLEPSFIFGLLYLSIFMSACLFLIFLMLVHKLGSDKASYAWILTPVVAMNMSYLFEGFQWDSLTVSGTLLVVLGGVFAIEDFKYLIFKKQSASAKPVI